MKEKIHFDTPDAKDFVATFRQLTNHHESWKVWSDFVTLSACSIAVQFDCADRDRVEQRLKWVSNVSDKYSDDELERFGKLLEITASALQADPNQDFLVGFICRSILETLGEGNSLLPGTSLT